MNMFMLRILFLSLFIGINLSADTNVTIEQSDANMTIEQNDANVTNEQNDTNVTMDQNSSYVDIVHRKISTKVVDISEKIDTTLSGFMRDDENNTSSKDKNITAEIQRYEQSIDAFYKNKKYTEETDETYVSIRLFSYFQTKEKSQYDASVNAQVPLVRSQKRFKLFIENLSKDSSEAHLPQEPQKSDSTPTIGISYFAPLYEKIKSKFYIASQGLNPLAKARVYVDIKAGQWTIEPVQTFTYSIKDKYEEETNLYFDYPTSKTSLFRTTLHRRTRDKADGMDYGLSLQHFWTLKRRAGISLTQSFGGNTEYEFLNKYGEKEKYREVSYYGTSLSWRENILKEWLYYQITPGINFQKQYDFQVNYTISFLFDIYFGNLNY